LVYLSNILFFFSWLFVSLNNHIEYQCNQVISFWWPQMEFGIILTDQMW
jgi:hypothetical protein